MALIGWHRLMELEGTAVGIRTTILGSFSAALIMLISAGESYALSVRGPNSLVIGGDRGGYLLKYALRMNKLKRSGTVLHFRGSCTSACTVYLALPRNQSCIAPGASFNFHLPYGSSAAGNRLAASYMLNSYPGWVRSWIRSKGGLSHKLISMNYSYAGKFMRTCSRSAASRTIRLARRD